MPLKPPGSGSARELPASPIASKKAFDMSVSGTNVKRSAPAENGGIGNSIRRAYLTHAAPTTTDCGQAVSSTH